MNQQLYAVPTKPRLVTTAPVLQAHGLNKRYGRIVAVDDVDVTVFYRKSLEEF